MRQISVDPGGRDIIGTAAGRDAADDDTKPAVLR
jgi:hypothetical protein